MVRGVELRKRRSSKSGLDSRCQRKISDASIIRGVEVEVDRTLPFWRCYTDLRLETRHRPEVARRNAELLCRIPCKVFKQVDVVWARTQVQLRRCGRTNAEGTRTKRRRVEKAAEQRSVSPSSFAFTTDNYDDDDDTVRYTIDTLHFVHTDAFKRGPGWERSFHVQSVVLRDAPEVLQCVAGAMVSFAFIVFTSLRLVHACATRHCKLNAVIKELVPLLHAAQPALLAGTPQKKRACCAGAVAQSNSADSSPSTEEQTRVGEQLRLWCPPPTSRVLVLGMGGNSMALALRAILGPDAVIEVVEVEPSVVAACVCVGTLHEDDTNMTVHLKDVDACLCTLPDSVYDFIFMDIFEPMGATMKNLHPWVSTAREKLTAGGLLVLNEHQLPSAGGLSPYVKLFGEGNVQAVNLRGWKESVVVCVAPGDAVTDGNGLEICKQHADMTFNIYEALLPGWLPHFSWLQSVQTRTHQKKRCRIWAS